MSTYKSQLQYEHVTEMTYRKKKTTSDNSQIHQRAVPHIQLLLCRGQSALPLLYQYLPIQPFQHGIARCLAFKGGCRLGRRHSRSSVLISVSCRASILLTPLLLPFQVFCCDTLLDGRHVVACDIHKPLCFINVTQGSTTKWLEQG